MVAQGTGARWEETGIVLTIQRSVASLSINGITEVAAAIAMRAGQYFFSNRPDKSFNQSTLVYIFAHSSIFLPNIVFAFSTTGEFEQETRYSYARIMPAPASFSLLRRPLAW
jgi:hypothetical protein